MTLPLTLDSTPTGNWGMVMEITSWVTVPDISKLGVIPGLLAIAAVGFLGWWVFRLMKGKK